MKKVCENKLCPICGKESDKNITNKVIEKFGYLKTKDVVEYMHKEKAYKETNEHEIIPFVEELKIKKF